MKLYLSSYGLGNQPEKFTSLIGANKRTAIIANAWDLSTPEERAGGLPEKLEALRGLGLEPEELDLRDYFRRRELLEKKIKEFGTLWILGGNSFVLLRAMNMSGFTNCVVPLVIANEVVYAGYSAGVVTATPDLHGIELVDDPIPVPEGYNKQTPWKGLSLIDFRIAPHYRSNHPESEATEQVVKYFKDNKLPYKALRDGEALVINGKSLELVG